VSATAAGRVVVSSSRYRSLNSVLEMFTKL
jgi:hypothetical protein